MPRVKATISYDGSNFIGWQEQKEGRSIEGSIRLALTRMNKVDTKIQGAGRTDSGVHANGQVIAFDTDINGLAESKMCRALNNFFPKDIRVRSVEYVDKDFHARFDARVRTYKYYVLASELPLVWAQNYSYRIVYKPQINALNALARKLIGTHDFTSFSAQNEQIPDRTRTIYSAYFTNEGPFLVFWISAPSFLWRMVRSLVGSLLAFEQEGISPQELHEKILQKDRSVAGPTAPALGLFLHRVAYNNEPVLF